MSDSDAPLRPQYAWKRFWCPRNGTLHLIDRGYLPDPSGPYGRLLGSDLRPFEDISDLPCLVLLGEPGIGKTTALRAEREKVEAAGDETLWMDLGGYGNEDRLVRKLFGSEKFTDWVAGDQACDVGVLTGELRRDRWIPEAPD